MDRQRIGQVLSHMGKLSEIDVNEILTEQVVTHRRFGEIALSWGLCEPQHIWRAWYEQLTDGLDHVDLEVVGVDARATAHLTRDLAEEYSAIPIRQFDDHLVIATSRPIAELSDLRQTLGDHVHFVSCDEAQVTMAIRAYYRAA